MYGEKTWLKTAFWIHGKKLAGSLAASGQSEKISLLPKHFVGS
jgi:hypothetical protein